MAEFTMHCTMQKRWIPHFLAMLEYMQYLGEIGSSRKVALYADGDGDFQPIFDYAISLHQDVKPKEDNKGHRLYDAG